MRLRSMAVLAALTLFTLSGGGWLSAPLAQEAELDGTRPLTDPLVCLARAIYFTSRAGQVVNEGLYMAVATVLAFVFRVENRMASEMDRPFITVPDDLRFDADGRKP